MLSIWCVFLPVEIAGIMFVVYMLGQLYKIWRWRAFIRVQWDEVVYTTTMMLLLVALLLLPFVWYFG